MPLNAEDASPRAQFAKNLRRLRIEKGFRTARELSKALGIEENRYTRYERAEVEPSLTLIHKMCETLRVSPNELLALHDDGGSVGSVGSAGRKQENDIPA
jgi:transcriptional regulator with XRE-family HTH domain